MAVIEIISILRDSSFIWLDTLAHPSVGLSVFAGLMTFYAFRLNQCGVRHEFDLKRRYLTEMEAFFFSPTSPIWPDYHFSPKSRDEIRTKFFHEINNKPLPGRPFQLLMLTTMTSLVVTINL
jgi:hypothetical protein